MGQYYSPVLVQGKTIKCFGNTTGTVLENGKVEYDWNGLKLTEHSWIGNSLVNGVAQRIYNRRGRLAWVGDYTGQVDKFKDNVFGSDNVQCPIPTDYLYGCSDEEGNDLKEYNGYRIQRPKIIYDEKKFNLTHKFYINFTRKEYIDLDEYIARSTMQDDWAGWCQNPVSLMTATSNGLGGGDYYMDAIGAEYVGRWAYDEVMISDDEPVGFTKLNVTFNENMKVSVSGVA